MKKEVKKVYDEIKEILKSLNYSDKKAVFYVDTFLYTKIESRLELNEIPFNDLEFFKELFVKYILIVFNKVEFLNYNTLSSDFTYLENFYNKYNDNEDIVKNKCLKNMIFISLLLEETNFLKPLYYMNITNLKHLLVITEYFNEKLERLEIITISEKKILVNYINYIISIRMFFKDENKYLTHCINLLDDIISKLNNNKNIQESDIDFNEIKNNLYNSDYVSEDMISSSDLFNTDIKGINEKINNLDNYLSKIEEKIDKEKYLKLLKEIKNTEIKINDEELEDFNKYHLIKENITKDIKSIKHKKYDELCKLIKDEKNVFIVEEEGSNVEETIKQIEKELDIEIIKQNIKSLNDVFKEGSEIYNSFIDSYINGKRLCFITESNQENFNTMFHSYGFFTEPTKYSILNTSKGFKMNAKMHPEFQIIIIVKEENLPEYELDMSKAEMAYHDYHDIPGFDKILLKDKDYPLMEYLYINNQELYYFFDIIKRNLCNVNNNDMLRFIKYNQSGLFDLEQLFNILFNDKELKKIDYFILKNMSSNKYIDYLITYLSELDKIKNKDKTKVKSKYFDYKYARTYIKKD